MTQVDSKFVMIAPMEVNEVLPFSVLSVFSVAKLFFY
jgi:hypothetical protein